MLLMMAWTKDKTISEHTLNITTHYSPMKGEKIQRMPRMTDQAVEAMSEHIFILGAILGPLD